MSLLLQFQPASIHRDLQLCLLRETHERNRKIKKSSSLTTLQLMSSAAITARVQQGSDQAVLAKSAKEKR